MDITEYYKSIAQELESLKNRVRNFISDGHWPTDGEWKESVLRYCLARNIPMTAGIGRGFVLTENGATTQCDILLYRTNSPIVFREGDLVFLTPDAVYAITEVKTRLTAGVLNQVLEKFAEIGTKLGTVRQKVLFSLFAYENDLSCETIKSALQQRCDHETKIIDLICAGADCLVKWWKSPPQGTSKIYEKWHIYCLSNMAPGYFISSVLQFVSPSSLAENAPIWFPGKSLEEKRTACAKFKHSLRA